MDIEEELHHEFKEFVVHERITMRKFITKKIIEAVNEYKNKKPCAESVYTGVIQQP